jgi:hypothetical protein
MNSGILAQSQKSSRAAVVYYRSHSFQARRLPKGCFFLWFKFAILQSVATTGTVFRFAGSRFFLLAFTAGVVNISAATTAGIPIPPVALSSFSILVGTIETLFV